MKRIFLAGMLVLFFLSSFAIAAEDVQKSNRQILLELENKAMQSTCNVAQNNETILSTDWCRRPDTSGFSGGGARAFYEQGYLQQKCKMVQAQAGPNFDCMSCTGTFPTRSALWHVLGGRIVKHEEYFQGTTIINEFSPSYGCMPWTVTYRVGGGSLVFRKDAWNMIPVLLDAQTPLLRPDYKTGEYIIARGEKSVTVGKNTLIEILGNIYQNWQAELSYQYDKTYNILSSMRFAVELLTNSKYARVAEKFVSDIVINGVPRDEEGELFMTDEQAARFKELVSETIEHWKKDNWTETIDSGQKAIGLYKKNPIVHRAVGDAFYYSGDKKRASERYIDTLKFMESWSEQERGDIYSVAKKRLSEIEESLKKEEEDAKKKEAEDTKKKSKKQMMAEEKKANKKATKEDKQQDDKEKKIKELEEQIKQLKQRE